MFGWKAKPYAGNRKGTRLKSTKSYIYFPEQKLGDGATSSVYLGRNKKTGEKVAVKVFNVSSYNRPDEVQDREFEVLHKLQHENIVRLLAVEDDSGTKERVIIMELCDCSVLNLLETPEYYFGFREDEFLGILKDISKVLAGLHVLPRSAMKVQRVDRHMLPFQGIKAEGMNYLQDVGIVHRDIKPGNIMRRFGPDKRPSFKLADFGAARELQEDQQFMSLYGTEEYLHPDMYGRALLRKTPNNPFTSKVDVWSLGATIYHIVTGNLPFRPFGGRKNKRTMYEMTANKATGVISAVQSGSMQGTIEYSKVLPVYCHLSEGLRQLVTPLLAGLLESNPNKMWPFQRFFEYTMRIFSMKTSCIFQPERSQLFKMYSEPESSLAEIQEQIASHTNIPADKQILVIDGHLFQPDSSVKCSDYPETSEQLPMILWQRGFNQITSEPILPQIPPIPDAPKAHSLDDDYMFARVCSAIVTFMMLSQRKFFMIFDLYPLVAKSCCGIVRSHTIKLQYHYTTMKGLRATAGTLLQSKQREIANVLMLLKAYLKANGNRTDVEGCQTTLNAVDKDISVLGDELSRIDIKFEKIDRMLNDLVPPVVESDPITKWDPDAKCSKSERCSERLEVFQGEIKNIYDAFKDDRRVAKLAHNDEQIHRMALQKLGEIATESTNLVYGHCQDNFNKSHANFTRWFSSLSDMRSKIDDLDEQLAPLSKQLTEFMANLQQELARWSNKIDETVKKMSGLLQTSIEPTTTPHNQDQCTYTDLETDGSLNDHQQMQVVPLPEGIRDHFKECTGGQPLIAVPKSLKKQLIRLESVETDTTDETIQQSRHLLATLSTLSCDITPVDLSDVDITDDEDEDCVIS